MRHLAACLVACLALLPGAMPGVAEERRIALEAPDALAETGLLRHILPRFSLKTQIRVEQAAPGAARLAPGAGRPVFSWKGETWGIEILEESAHARRFADWLASDVGQNTLQSFEGGAFGPPGAREVAPRDVDLSDADTAEGDRLAHLHCGRCHVVSQRNSLGGIGSTPSFGAMKNFSDWEEKFTIFFALNPHPSFMQIESITEPFDPSRPPPIAPIELTEAEYEAILAYVRKIPVKDLGGAIEAN